MQQLVEEEHIHKIPLEDLPNNNNNIKAIHTNNNKMELSNNKDIDGLNKQVLTNSQIGMIQVFKHKFLTNYLECKIKLDLVEERINNMILYVKLCNNL
jgi:hypothetical protein